VLRDDIRALAHDVHHYEHERHERDQERQDDDERGDGALHAPSTRTPARAQERRGGRSRSSRRGRDRRHPDPTPSRLLDRRSTALAMLPRMIVMMRSTSPNPMRAARCSPLDSPNWLAMMLASVSPGPRMFALSFCEDPTTRATAIVSPTARPK